MRRSYIAYPDKYLSGLDGWDMNEIERAINKVRERVDNVVETLRPFGWQFSQHSFSNNTSQLRVSAYVVSISLYINCTIQPSNRTESHTCSIK